MHLSPTPPDWDYASKLARVQERMDAACEAAGRNCGEVQMLIATKSWDADAVAGVVQAGAFLVGENKAQELAVKADRARNAGAQMHFIGHLQRNKAQYVIDLVDCVQSVDSLDLAQRLDRVAADRNRVLDVMVQVNVSGEESKSGFELVSASESVGAIAELENLRLTGFMTIGANTRDERAVREGYAALTELRDTVRLWGGGAMRDAHHLSMGMSGDIEWAIAEGATIVRVGSAVMGDRPPVRQGSPS